MKNSGIAVHVFALAAITCIVSGCSDTCDDNRNSLPLAGFYVSGADNSEKISVSDLAVVAVGLGGDSILSAETVAKDQLYLPFRIDSDRTQYVFELKREGATVSDTVTFDYARVPRFTNASCGVCYIYEMQTIFTRNTLIDSVVCPKGYIDNVNEENLRVYFNADILDAE